MTDVIASRIQGAFTGYNGSMIFRLINGQVWQQRRYKYKYKYAYRPAVRIYREGGGYLMAVEGMTDPIEVVKVAIVEEGMIISDFRGYSGGRALRVPGWARLGSCRVQVSLSLRVPTSCDSH